jgi:hypothetical protein
MTDSVLRLEAEEARSEERENGWLEEAFYAEIRVPL